MEQAKNTGSSVWQIIRLGIILAIYAVVCCTVLALINAATAPVIAANKAEKAAAAMKQVFPQAESFQEPSDTSFISDGSSRISVDSLKLAVSGGNVIGAAVQVTGPTYEQSTIIVGMDKNGIVTGMRYVENTDTRGFGLNGSDPAYILPSGKTFYGQFEGKDSADGFKAGETFDAISGATITSNGIAELMTEACSAMKKALEAQ